jgi:hypothetical protein
LGIATTAFTGDNQGATVAVYKHILKSSIEDSVLCHFGEIDANRVSSS